MVAHKWWHSLFISFLSTINGFKNKKNNTRNGVSTINHVGRQNSHFYGRNTKLLLISTTIFISIFFLYSSYLFIKLVQLKNNFTQENIIQYVINLFLCLMLLLFIIFQTRFFLEWIEKDRHNQKNTYPNHDNCKKSKSIGKMMFK